MLLELCGLAVPFLVYIMWVMGVIEDELLALTLVGSTSSITSLLLWLYSRRLARVYQEERWTRMRCRREIIRHNVEAAQAKVKVVSSQEDVMDDSSTLRSRRSTNIVSEDGDERERNTSNENLLSASLTGLPRTVSRLSPVFPAFASLLLALLSLVCLINGLFYVALVILETSKA